MALIKCPECGKEISDTSKTCIHCGYKIEKEINTKPQARRRKKWLIPVIIGGIVLTLLVAGLPLIYLIWYFLSNK